MLSPPVVEQRRLAPHQLEGVTYLLTHPYSIIGAGTGTGKTGIMAHAARYISEREYPACRFVLLVVPNSLMEQTQEELEIWHGADWVRENVVQMYGWSQRTRYTRLRQRPSNERPIYIISHEMLSDHHIADALARRQWGAVFVDEGSRFRNNSLRTKALVRLHERADIRSVFSGTLAVRNAADVWYPCRFLQPGLFRGIRERGLFLRQYFLLGGFTGRDVIGERPDTIGELRRILAQFTWRVNLSDIRDMPERTMVRRRVDLRGEQRVAYTQFRDTLILEIERMNDEDFRLQVQHYVTRILRLQEIAAGFARNADGDVEALPSAKTTELLAILDDDAAPAIVWTWWKPEQRRIVDTLSRAGHLVTTDRAQFVDGTADILVMSPASGGYGLNLDRARRMIYHSLPWDLDLYIQSQERNWRMTTTEPKEIIHLIATDTIDERVRDKLLDKARISERSMGRSDALSLLR